MFQFKGGKGILSGGTIALMVDWRIALVVWGGFLLLVILTRYVSLGSTWAGASFPFATWLCFPNQPLVIVLGFVCGGLVVWQHRANIKRLLSGTENKFSFRRKKT
jgi:glycerol-3-phosphate acyltransferase PlsY